MTITDNEMEDEYGDDEDDEDNSYFFFDDVLKVFRRNNDLTIKVEDLGVNPDFKRDDIDGFAWMLADSNTSYTIAEMNVLRQKAEADYCMHRLIHLGLAEWAIDESGVVGITIKKVK